LLEVIEINAPFVPEVELVDSKLFEEGAESLEPFSVEQEVSNPRARTKKIKR
jgi:hypothetical protein